MGVCVYRSNQQSSVEVSGRPVDATSDTDYTPAAETGGTSSGPRIKHVCRYQSIALGKPLATFPPVTSSQLQLSALPSQEKERILVDTAPGVYMQGDHFSGNVVEFERTFVRKLSKCLGKSCQEKLLLS